MTAKILVITGKTKFTKGNTSFVNTDSALRSLHQITRNSVLVFDLSMATFNHFWRLLSVHSIT